VSDAFGGIPPLTGGERSVPSVGHSPWVHVIPVAMQCPPSCSDVMGSHLRPMVLTCRECEWVGDTCWSVVGLGSVITLK
jgi:hypothetical protein